MCFIHVIKFGNKKIKNFIKNYVVYLRKYINMEIVREEHMDRERHPYIDHNQYEAAKHIVSNIPLTRMEFEALQKEVALIRNVLEKVLNNKLTNI